MYLLKNKLSYEDDTDGVNGSFLFSLHPSSQGAEGVKQSPQTPSETHSISGPFAECRLLLRQQAEIKAVAIGDPLGGSVMLSSDVSLVNITRDTSTPALSLTPNTHAQNL